MKNLKLQENLDQIEKPGVRLSLTMLMIGITTLASVIVFLSKVLNTNNNERIKILNERIIDLKVDLNTEKLTNIILVRKYDSLVDKTNLLILKAVDDKSRTIIYVDSILKNQYIIKNLSEKLMKKSK